MKNIEEIHYIITGVGSDFDGKGFYMLEREILGENICKITALGETNNRENDESYLVFSKKIDDTERSADIAFSIVETNKKINFVKTTSPYVSVYFPTETESRLNFIVQAPFDLTPNRSSLERNSERNDFLTKTLAALLMESVVEIKNRRWLSLEFIDLLPYNSSNSAYVPDWHFYAFHKSVLRMLLDEEIIPTIDNSYVSVKNAKIVRGAKLIELFEGDLLRKLLSEPNAKWLSKDFTENGSLRALHSFLKELGAKEIGSNDLPRLIKDNPSFLESVDNDWLAAFYAYLTNDVKNLLEKNSDLATVPFVKTSDGNFNPPFVSRRNGRKIEMDSNIFIRPKGANYSVEGFLFVDEFIEQNCLDFLDAVGLTEPAGFDYFIKELEAGRFHEEIEQEANLSQVKRAIKYLKAEQEKAQDILSDLLWLKVKDTNEVSWFANSHQNIYREKDYNGVSLKDYFSEVDCGVYILDEQFYLDGGISISDIKFLEQLGIKNSIYEKIDTTYWRDGNADCYNKGDFRKLLDFAHIHIILRTIHD